MLRELSDRSTGLLDRECPLSFLQGILQEEQPEGNCLCVFNFGMLYHLDKELRPDARARIDCNLSPAKEALCAWGQL